MVEDQICAWQQLSKQFAYHVAFNSTKGLDVVKSKHTLNCVAAEMCVGQVGEGKDKIVGALCSMKVEVNQRLKGDIKAQETFWTVDQNRDAKMSLGACDVDKVWLSKIDPEPNYGDTGKQVRCYELSLDDDDEVRLRLHFDV